MIAGTVTDEVTGLPLDFGYVNVYDASGCLSHEGLYRIVRSIYLRDRSRSGDLLRPHQ